MNNENLKNLLGIPTIRAILEPAQISHISVYSVEYQQNYIRGRLGDWQKPQKCHKAIWGWVEGLRDGEHI